VTRETATGNGHTVTIVSIAEENAFSGGSAATDVDLVARILQDHEHEAFRILVQRYQKMLWSLFWRGTGSREDSEELVQEVLYRAWRSLAEYRPEHKFHTWLYTIAINCLRSHLKKSRIRQTLFLRNGEHNENVLASAHDRTGSVDHRIDESEAQRLVNQLLGRLRERYRIPLIMHYFDGMSVSSVSEILGTPENTVKTHLKRGRDEIERMIRANPVLTAFFSSENPSPVRDKGGST